MGAEEKLARIRAEKLVTEAIKLREEEKLEEALALLAEAESVDPMYEESYYWASGIYNDLEDYDKAREILQNALSRGLTSARLHDATGDNFLKRGDYEAAILQYEKAILIEPNYALALSGIGICHYHLKNHQKAIEFLNLAIAKRPGY